MDVNDTKIYKHRWDKGNDVDQWFLMGSPVPVMMIMASYWLFVLKLGPMYMKHRSPYPLGTSFLWNNGVLQTECLKADMRKTATIGTYTYFLAKLSELLDTVFFILRKKYNQASFLHIYHHSCTVLSTWAVLKYEPNVNALVFIGTINSYVHIVMYSYYGLSAYPELAKYLWWKKYITKMQLVQFVLILAHFLTEYKLAKCKPSYVVTSVVCFNLLLFVYLFTDFYRKTYKKNQSVDNDRKGVKKVD
ncbi:elongation of very long chain fatty acids protein 7-like [Zerene cesonia]|uniref:elongation of very long chain fatty acids protein 7-like n=1 Tax=Zerene cesonia TaxID=33412 RepID=UPI0018E5711E|nr:elongation of very long chain fatty acids protein 7-like [Zerene cesonia]